MKRSYEAELEALPATYATALGANVAELREALGALGQGAAVFVGSGGTMVPATLAVRLHELRCRQPARACTSLELVGLPQLDRRGALLFSSSAKHPDARMVLAEFRRARFAPTVVMTHRASDDLEELAGSDARIPRLPSLGMPDGFLATGSVMQMCVLLLRAYLGEPGLPARLPPAEDEGPPLREEVLVLAPPALASVAVDVEVRLVESGAAGVQVTDCRNFAHGRHTGFARRLDRTTVLVLSERESEALVSATVGALPRSADIRRWHSAAAWPAAVVELLFRSMRLARQVERSQGLDLARPTVPQFGRRLYRLPLARRVASLLTGGVERKMLALGAGDDPRARDIYVTAGREWIEKISAERFGGLVLDYDGTICWTRRRFDVPRASTQQLLLSLLERGMSLGFASGRGRSLHQDLRHWVPEPLWPRIVVGLYNGAVRVALDDDLPDLREPSAWSRTVATALGTLPLAELLAIEERGAQVTVGDNAVTLATTRLAELLRAHLTAAAVDAQVVASGHGVDIVAAETRKTAVREEIERRSGQQALVIGDQGQIVGNDHALLSDTRWSLTVDRSSADPSRCWFAGAGDRTGPDQLEVYLKALHQRRGGFALRGVEVS